MGVSGYISILLSFARRVRNGVTVGEVKADPAAGINLTLDHYAPPGDDSQPLPGDYVHASATRQSGRYSAVGYLDPSNPPISDVGEKRIYSRDASGQVVAEIWLKNDGTILINNYTVVCTLTPDGGFKTQNSAAEFSVDAAGSILLQNAGGSINLLADGVINLNGVVIDQAGNITTPTSVAAPSLIAGGKEMSNHTHNILSGSSFPGPTGPNN